MREISSYISKQEAGRDCRTCLLPDTGCGLDASFSFQQHFHSVGKRKEEHCLQPRDSCLAHPTTRPHPFLCNLQSVASALLCMLSVGVLLCLGAVSYPCTVHRAVLGCVCFSWIETGLAFFSRLAFPFPSRRTCHSPAVLLVASVSIITSTTFL